MIERKIREIINKKDFIYLDDFIRICHQDSKNGYYRKREVIGRDGDFITSPEISQLFGEMVSFCLINQIIQKNIRLPRLRLCLTIGDSHHKTFGPF